MTAEFRFPPVKVPKVGAHACCGKCREGKPCAGGCGGSTARSPAARLDPRGTREERFLAQALSNPEVDRKPTRVPRALADQTKQTRLSPTAAQALVGRKVCECAAKVRVGADTNDDDFDCFPFTRLDSGALERLGPGRDWTRRPAIMSVSGSLKSISATSPIKPRKWDDGDNIPDPWRPDPMEPSGSIPWSAGICQPDTQYVPSKNVYYILDQTPPCYVFDSKTWSKTIKGDLAVTYALLDTIRMFLDYIHVHHSDRQKLWSFHSNITGTDIVKGVSTRASLKFWFGNYSPASLTTLRKVYTSLCRLMEWSLPGQKFPLTIKCNEPLAPDALAGAFLGGFVVNAYWPNYPLHRRIATMAHEMGHLTMVNHRCHEVCYETEKACAIPGEYSCQKPYAGLRLIEHGVIEEALICSGNHEGFQRSMLNALRDGLCYPTLRLKEFTDVSF